MNEMCRFCVFPRVLQNKKSIYQFIGANSSDNRIQIPPRISSAAHNRRRGPFTATVTQTKDTEYYCWATDTKLQGGNNNIKFQTVLCESESQCEKTTELCVGTSRNAETVRCSIWKALLLYFCLCLSSCGRPRSSGLVRWLGQTSTATNDKIPGRQPFSSWVP